MASFMDNEAVESDDDELSDDEERARAQVGPSLVRIGLWGSMLYDHRSWKRTGHC